MTLIVLLILAGVSISGIVGNQGIFKRAEQGAEVYNRGKAREKLELTLTDAQLIKHTEGLTDEQLTNKINEVGEELEERTNPDISQAIVDGYIFEIDRTVPKILDYLGKADGVIITATITGNNGWLKPSEANVTVTGKIKTYSGGRITNVNATKGDTLISGFSIDGEGRYIIDNITEDTTIVINAEDSNEKKNTRTIPITIRIDNIPPVVDTVTATAKVLEIKFSATGHDNESGIKHFNYTITSTQDTTLEGIPANKRTGTFTPGQTVKITTTPTGNRDETTYSITVTATDNANNTTEASRAKTTEVTTIDGITLEEAKRLVNEDTLKEYIGTRVIDYTPEAGGTWRVFYYDKDNYFGDGEGSLYLKADVMDLKTKFSSLESHINHVSSDNCEIMRKMNPLWSTTKTESGFTGFTSREYYSSWFNDPNVWTDFYDGNKAKYVIGTPSLEMFVKAYCCYMSDENILGYAIGGDNYPYYTFKWKNSNGEIEEDGEITPTGSILPGKNHVFASSIWYFLGSPGWYAGSLDYVHSYSYGQLVAGYYAKEMNCAPIACIRK